MMTTANAARELGLLPETYRTLEYLPSKLSITTDTILHIASITHIPLEVLVDYLTETTTKEMA